jgi:RHS repeat-associated protein
VNQAGNAAPTSGQASPYRLYGYNLNGEPTQIERRDASGAPVQHERFDWDGMGKLRQVWDLVGNQSLYTATYDGGGTRVGATLGGTTHAYSAGLHDSAGNTTFTPGISQRQNGADRFFHQDWLGSTRYLTDSTGNSAPTAYRFDAYGRQSAAAGPDSTSFKWAGGWGYQSDAPSGLQLLGARYYDPAVGRFLNPDPIGFAGGLNQYLYGDADPVNSVDPEGTSSYTFLDRDELKRTVARYQTAKRFRDLTGRSPRPGEIREVQPGVYTIIASLQFRPGSTGTISPHLLQAGREAINIDKVNYWYRLMSQGCEVPPIEISPRGVIYQGNSRAYAASILGRAIDYQVRVSTSELTPYGPAIERPLYSPTNSRPIWPTHSGPTGNNVGLPPRWTRFWAFLGRITRFFRR